MVGTYLSARGIDKAVVPLFIYCRYIPIIYERGDIMDNDILYLTLLIIILYIIRK